MTTHAPNPVLEALVRSATEATGAELGVLLRADAAALRVVATAGDAAHPARGAELAADAGAAGYVVASGQPLALSARSGDPRLSEGIAEVLGRQPASVLCVPCTTDEATVGALQLLDAAEGHFSFDDVELATLLADIAGVALTQGGDGAVVSPPAELGGELERLARSDPARYATVATLVDALLARE